MPTRAVLFDFDGVLADTENIHISAWERAFERMGLEVPAEVCARAGEVDDRQFLSEVFAEREISNGDLEGWLKWKREWTLGMLRDAPRIYPGVAALVARLRGDVRLAVVSGTCRENVRAVLEAAGLGNAFGVIVGNEDVKAVKPEPDAYRSALRRLKLKPVDAVALEDSPTGLDAASAAGVRVIAVGHRRKRGEWSGDHPFLPDLKDTDAVIAALGLDAS